MDAARELGVPAIKGQGWPFKPVLGVLAEGGKSGSVAPGPG